MLKDVVQTIRKEQKRIIKKMHILEFWIFSQGQSYEYLVCKKWQISSRWYREHGYENVNVCLWFFKVLAFSIRHPQLKEVWGNIVWLCDSFYNREEKEARKVRDIANSIFMGLWLWYFRLLSCSKTPSVLTQ